MTARMDRIRQARLDIQREAAQRWIERAPQRSQAKQELAAHGPGAADSPARREAFRQRHMEMALCRQILPAGALPLGIERRIGSTVDWVGSTLDLQAKKAGRPVARLVEVQDTGYEPEGFGTGFLISSDLLMTNWHVFETSEAAEGCAANFLYEETDKGVSRGLMFRLNPERFFLNDKTLDYCMVAVEPRAESGEALAEMGQCTLLRVRPKILIGQAINIIQYPNGGPKRYALSQNRLVDILEEPGMLQYETDTDPGSSGSPAFNEHWELVALHHASIPLMRDEKPLTVDGDFWTEEMGDDAVHWIANEGIRASSIVTSLEGKSMATKDQHQLLSTVIEAAADPVPDALGIAQKELAKQAGAPGPEPHNGRGVLEGQMAGIQFLFTGPVTVNVAAGQQISPEKVQAGIAVVEKSIRFDPDYDLREGYDPYFLDEERQIKVEIPTVVEARASELYTGRDGKPVVLKYHHFELVMNEARRLQMWSAANLDYSPSRKTDGDRESWGKDRWIPDPRIPAAVQIFDADFYKPAGNIDRGHVVRREDNEWGDDEMEIEFANSDTFHWTNCTPQHEAFNQSNPARNDRTYRGREGVWGAFENHIQQSRKGDDTKACIIAGPILAKGDPKKDFGRGEIQYPIRFFKIVCVVEPSEQGKRLCAFGFILSQGDVVKEFGIEKFEPGRFKRLQSSLKEIEEATGLVFAETLHAADVMAGERARQIDTVADIVGT